jgi:hypothetical protein
MLDLAPTYASAICVWRLLDLISAFQNGPKMKLNLGTKLTTPRLLLFVSHCAWSVAVVLHDIIITQTLLPGTAVAFIAVVVLMLHKFHAFCCLSLENLRHLHAIAGGGSMWYNLQLGSGLALPQACRYLQNN